MKMFDKEIKAVIFDLDGTLLDSTGIWKIIDKNFFEKRNMEVPPTYSDEIAHIGLQEAAIYTKKKYNIEESPEMILNEWHEGSINQYKYEIQLKDNVKEYLDYLKANNIKIGAATANTRDLYEPCLKRLGIYDYFEIIADVDKVKGGKNSSKIYEFVANKLESKPENTIVFEDISLCLKTAKDANFITIAVYDKSSEKEEKEKIANSYKFIRSFKEMM